MSVGIASLWWNHEELLPEFLCLMAGQPWDRLVLVDNASTDEANALYHEVTRQLGPGASVLRMARNSVLDGWNAGMAALDTDIVIQMANDVIMVDRRWLEWGLDGLAPGILQGPVCWYRGFPYIDGCMVVAMREDWERLGGLDAKRYAHPGYWSDVDLCYRALRLGLTVRPCRSGIRHITNYSGGNLPPHLEANQNNALVFANRFLEPLWEQRQIIWTEEENSGSRNPVQP